MSESSLEQDLTDRLNSRSSVRPASLRRGEAGPRLASNAQQRYWCLHEFDPLQPTYSVPLGFHIRGDLSVDRFDRALTTIVARHSVFRTSLVMRDGVLWQDPMPAVTIRSTRLEAGSFTEAHRRAGIEAATALDLGRPPLLRSLVFRIAPDEHFLLLILHHAVCDAWSIALFFEELSTLYAAADTPDIEQPTFAYADYTDWQRQWLSSPRAEVQRQYWRARLGGSLPLLRLNYAAPARGERRRSGAVKSLPLDEELMPAISGLASLGRTTDFVVLLSAFLATLYRYALQDEIVVGVPVACRVPEETANIIGCFANTVAVRSQLRPRQSFSRLMEQTSNDMIDALTHQELPFDRVVGTLGLPRESDNNPLFQAMFVMEDAPLDGTLRLERAELTEVVVHSGTAKFDVTCSIRRKAGGFEGEIEYSLDVMNEASAARFADAFINLLYDAAFRPTAPIEELRMVAPAEGMLLIEAVRTSFETYPDFRPAHRHVEEQMRRTPDAIAIVAGGKSIRYDELNARANDLAWRLIGAGAGPETLIGIYLDRSIHMVVALLATLKSGAGYVPLDPGFPLERIRGICEHAALRFIVTEEAYRQELGSLPCCPILMFADTSGGGAKPDPGICLSPANVAYVYYTSGSTGTPKGVITDHVCAMSRLEWLRRRYPLARGDRVLHKTPLIFDVAIWEIFLPLMAGATILMADDGRESDVAHVGDLLSAEGTVLGHFVPSMLAAYLNHAPPRRYPDLNWVALSGEAVPRRTLEQFTQHFKIELHNHYGQSETSEVAAWEGTDCGGMTAVPIGRQIGIYRLHVLDAALNPVPPGVPGELCVAGIGGLARGYHSSAALTAAKFVPHPYPVLPGERLYRTGDLVRLSESGVIEHLGRLDFQTKIAGCRVEPAEIEMVLNTYPSVSASAAVIRSDGSVDQLIAYVVGDRGALAGLAAHAERVLPRYMLPAAYVFVDRLPLTPSGKLDRRSLPAPTASDFSARVRDQAAQSRLEEELISLWKQTLGLDKLGRTDNFFTVGGNSLNAIKVLHKIRDTFEIDVSVRDFFTSPTVEGLASLVEDALVRLVGSLSDAEAEWRLREG